LDADKPNLKIIELSVNLTSGLALMELLQQIENRHLDMDI
jgi:hypothetical protein